MPLLGLQQALAAYQGPILLAVCYFLGAQAAFPGRQVVSMSGDGGFTMLMGDMLSLRQLGLPVKIDKESRWRLR